MIEIALENNDESLVRGLKEYREWIYPQLDAEDLADKRLRYFTPEQVDEFVSAHEN